MTGCSAAASASHAIHVTSARGRDWWECWRTVAVAVAAGAVAGPSDWGRGKEAGWEAGGGKPPTSQPHLRRGAPGAQSALVAAAPVPRIVPPPASDLLDLLRRYSGGRMAKRAEGGEPLATPATRQERNTKSRGRPPRHSPRPCPHGATRCPALLRSAAAAAAPCPAAASHYRTSPRGGRAASPVATRHHPPAHPSPHRAASARAPFHRLRSSATALDESFPHTPPAPATARLSCSSSVLLSRWA